MSLQGLQFPEAVSCPKVNVNSVPSSHPTRNPSDPLPRAPAETNSKPACPPPYHIAAAMSKRAADFGNGGGVSDSASVASDSSSLQTIVRSPLQQHQAVAAESRITSLRGSGESV